MPPKKKKGKKKKVPPRIEAPTCTSAGTAHIDIAKDITLCCATPGATVHFTLDGSDPTPDTRRFVRPFDVKTAGTTDLRAIAVGVDGMLDSPVSELQIMVEVDPWRRHRSAFGGKLSAVEEWDKISTGQVGRALFVSSECVVTAAAAAAEAAAVTTTAAAGSAVRLVGGAALDSLVLGAADAAMRDEAAVAAATAAAEQAVAAAAAEAAEGDDEAGGGDGGSGGVGTACVAASHRVETSEGSHVTTVAVASTEGSVGAASAPITVAAAAPLFNPDSPAPELSSIESVALIGCELAAFELSSTSKLRSSLTALNLADNVLADGALVIGSPVCWLRTLVLAANRFSVVPPLALAPKLLSLDLSFNVMKTFGGADVFSAAPLLMDLRLERCGLETVQYAGVSPLSQLKGLTALDLSGNQLRNVDELKQLFVRSHLPQLADLDLSGNACSDSEEYRLWAARYAMEHGPLCVLDGKQQHKEIATAGVSELQLHVDDPMVQDSASCSCLEGNPCAVKYNCKNWSRRIEIAKEVRRKKKLLLGF